MVGRRLLTTTRRTVDGCGSAGWGGLLHGLQRWYRRADEWVGGRERRRRNDIERESAGGDTWNRVRPSRSGPRAMYAHRVLNSDPFTRAAPSSVPDAQPTARHHHYHHPWPSTRVGGGGAGARAFTDTHAQTYTCTLHTHETHTRAHTHGVGDALATMRNRSASVRIKVTTPPYSALYTGCFYRVTNRLTRTQSSIHLSTIISGYSVFFYAHRHRPRHWFVSYQLYIFL